jgi:ribosomal protein S18 acetylase RimI-like enzyme
VNDLSFAELERVEAATMSGLALAGAGDIRTVRIGGGLVVTRSGTDSLFWNRATAFDRVVTRADLDEVRAHLEDRGVKRVLLRAAPAALPDDWDEIVAEAGLTAEFPQTKWAAAAEAAVESSAGARTGLRVERVRPADARRWAEVLCAAAGLDDGSVAVFAAMTGRPGGHAYAAWDGDAIVGTGLLHVDGRIGHLYAGTVAETHRRRGAQSALIAARVRAAHRAGAEWVTSDTVGGAAEPDVSGRNMIRSGFAPLYERPAWLWQL